MKIMLLSLVIAFSASAFAKDYQVTGPIVEVTDTKIVVDKKGEKFEISKAAATKVAGGFNCKRALLATVFITLHPWQVVKTPVTKQFTP